jgi:putative aldouronate transport system permease protein
MWRARWMYVLMLPGVLYFVIFRYVPLLGYIVAFQNYSPWLGFTKSPFVGLDNFRALLSDPDVGVALRNTLEINALQLIFFFPAPILLALLLNSLRNELLKRLNQAIVYLPHFLGWVIIIALWQLVLGADGVINQFLRSNGWPGFSLMENPDLFKPLVVLQLIWRNAGWGTIIILAALTRIDLALYEAAVIDGATRFRRLWHVTLPGIRSICVLLFILQLGSLLSVGFEQMFLQRDAVGPDAAEVLDTFVYFHGIINGDWGLATAVGLLSGVVGFILIVAANHVAHRFGEEGLF